MRRREGGVDGLVEVWGGVECVGEGFEETGAVVHPYTLGLGDRVGGG